MGKLFKEKDHQDKFDRDGYVILDFLRSEDLDNLQAYYSQHFADIPKVEIYESSRENDPEANLDVQRTISGAFEYGYGKFFEPGNIFFGGTFMVKAPKNSNTLPLHQDWSIIDEDNFDTVFIWCPIVPIRNTNGGLFLLPSSHKLFNNYRSGSLPTPRVKLPGFMKSLVKDVEIEAGQCVAYSTSLFHGSYPNVDDEDRVIATGQVVEKGADLIYYRKSSEDDSKVEAYRMPPKTYLNDIRTVDQGGVPENAELIEVVPNRNQLVSDLSLSFRMLKHTIKRNNLSRLFDKNRRA